MNTMAKPITTTATPLPPRPGRKQDVDKMIDRMVGMLAQLPVVPYDPERERVIGEEMLRGLELELEERDRKRRELWGDKFPHRLNQKPPEGYVPFVKPVNPVTKVENGAEKPGKNKKRKKLSDPVLPGEK